MSAPKKTTTDEAGTTVLAGYPDHGKTTAACSLAFELAEGAVVVQPSAEGDPESAHDEEGGAL